MGRREPGSDVGGRGQILERKELSLTLLQLVPLPLRFLFCTQFVKATDVFIYLDLVESVSTSHLGV